MGLSTKYFIIDSSDKIHSITRKRMEGLYDGLPECAFQEYAGMKIKTAEYILETESRNPVDYIRKVYSYISFNDEGFPSMSYVSDMLNTVGIPGRKPSDEERNKFFWIPDSRLEGELLSRVMKFQ